MQHVLVTTSRKGEGMPGWSLALVMSIIAATNAGFTVGLLTMLSWQESLTVIIAASALAGGIVFTVLEMQRLARESK
jgi:Trk-type K+ transport system membrane component